MRLASHIPPTARHAALIRTSPWIFALTSIIVLASTAAALGAPAPDPTFGTSGVVTLDLRIGEEQATNVLIQPDDRIVMAVSTVAGPALVRLNTNGQIDTTFGVDGLVSVPHYLQIADIVQTNNGDTIVRASRAEGYPANIILKYNNDGVYDAAFGEVTIYEPKPGWEIAQIGGMAFQEDGKLVVVGSLRDTETFEYPEDLMIIRLLADGSLDPAFGAAGLVTVDTGDVGALNSVVIGPAGEIVVGGHTGSGREVDHTNAPDMLLMRFDDDGTIDSSFGRGGSVTASISDYNGIYRVMLRGHDKIIGVGQATADMASSSAIVAMWNWDGSPDRGFGESGLAVLDGRLGELIGPIGDVVIQPDHKIVLANIEIDDGGVFLVYLARLNADGTPDTSFGDRGRHYFTPNIWIYGLALDAQNRIVAVGTQPGAGDDPLDAWATRILSDVAFDGLRFVDDDLNLFEADIAWLAEQGITRGCNPPANDRFCPREFVSRSEMAAFLVRAFGYTDPGTGDLFTDDDSSIFEGDIDRLGTAGITKGCNPPANDRFCPERPVTRGQMAAFLVRALDLSDSGTTDFVDDDDSIFELDIEKLATAGITRGCNPPENSRFCPTDYLTRAQLAALLHRALK